MKLKTRQFGEIHIEEEKIITMNTGMPGFPEKNRFIILEHEAAKPFYWYQCVDDPQLALTIINPYLFKPDYFVGLESVIKEMAWTKDGKDNLKIYVIVNAANGGAKKITANLIGPLLINTLKNEAVQLVLYNSAYSHKHPIFNNGERKNI